VLEKVVDRLKRWRFQAPGTVLWAAIGAILATSGFKKAMAMAKGGSILGALGWCPLFNLGLWLTIYVACQSTSLLRRSEGIRPGYVKNRTAEWERMARRTLVGLVITSYFVILAFTTGLAILFYDLDPLSGWLFVAAFALCALLCAAEVLSWWRKP